MPKTLTAFAIPFAALLTGLASAPALGPERIHERYEIAPGQHTLLVFPNTGTAIADVDLAFNGGPSVRIHRVRANCMGPDVTFQAATPHEATAFFAGAPFSTGANYFEITVENLGDRPASLQFKLSFVRGSNPACGL